MRKFKLFVAAAIFLIAGALTAKPFNVSYRLGNSITGFQFMLKSAAERRTPKAIIPTIGLSYAGGSTTFEEEAEDEIYDDTSSRTTLTLLLPRVGFRGYRSPVGDLEHYTFVEVFYVIPMVDGEEDGEKMSNKEKEEIEDALDALGISLGYGTEYHVSEQFSIGGELFFTGAYWDAEEKVSGYYGGDWIRKSRAILGATIARATLNYYFK